LLLVERGEKAIRLGKNLVYFGSGKGLDAG
jgi:hypothetical protein